MMKLAVLGLLGIAASAVSAPAFAQTTIQSTGPIEPGYMLFSGSDRSSTWAGQIFTSPGGVLSDFSFTSTGAGHGTAQFHVALMNNGYVGPSLFARTITMLDGATPIDAIGLETLSGAKYLAYVTQGDLNNEVADFYGYINVHTNFQAYPDGGGLSYFSKAPVASQDYGRGYYDLAFSASFVPQISAVPEPATWGMMIFGFGVVGAASRYRRRSVKVSAA